MKIERTKHDVEYTLVVDQDELDLLAAILGQQHTDTVGLKHLFNSMVDAGADFQAWQRAGDRAVSTWVKKEKK